MTASGSPLVLDRRAAVARVDVRLAWLAAVAAALALPAAAVAQQGVTVRGVVRGADAQPLGLAEIIVGDSVLARTDSAGRFSVTGLAPGSVELFVRRLGFAPLSVPMTLARGRDRNLAIELAPLPQALPPVIVSAKRRGLFGRVIAEGGKPIEGARVQVVGVDTALATGPDGGFGIFGLDSRTYYVVVTKPDYYAARFTVTLPPDAGQEVQVELDLLPADMSAGARRLASGDAAVDRIRMYELDRRMALNRPYLVPREVMEKGRKRGALEHIQHAIWMDMEMVAERATTLGQPTLDRVKKSGVEKQLDAPLPPNDDDLAGIDGRPLDGACYFLDGQKLRDAQMVRALAAEWVETVEIARRDYSGTLRARLPIGVSPAACRVFVVIWLRR